MAWIQHKEWSALTSALVASFSTIFKSKLLTPLHSNPMPLTYSGTCPFAADPHIQAWDCITLASLLHGIFGESHGCTCSNSMTKPGVHSHRFQVLQYGGIYQQAYYYELLGNLETKQRERRGKTYLISYKLSEYGTSECRRPLSQYGPNQALETQMATARNHSLLWWGSRFNFQSRVASNKINQCTSSREKKT